MLLAADAARTRRRVTPFGGSAALHVLVLLAISYPLSSLSTGAPAAAPATSPVVIFTAPPEAIAGVDASDNAEAPSEPEDLGIELPPGSATIDVDNFTFDFAAVVSRASSLFPFLDHALLDGLSRFERADDSAPLANPLLHLAGPDGQAPPLVLSEVALQSLTDEAWSRRHRWQAFQTIASLAERHSASEGRLPDLLRAYVDQNLLQLFVDTSTRDPRLWAQLGVAADHRHFVEFILAYASRHAATRGRTELLFLLDKLVQSNLHALITLIDTNPAVQLQRTRAANADAYHAVMTIRRHNLAALERRGLASREALLLHFDEARLTILGNILRTTPDGYRRGDARYLIGDVHWRQGDRAEAIRTWRAINIEPSDTYSATYSAIVGAIRAAGDHPVSRIAIEQSLAREHGTWVAGSIERLLRFGYHVDEF